MAPAYFSVGPGGEHSLLIGGEGRQPGRAGFVNVAERSGLKPARALDILDEVDAAIGRWTEFSEIAKVTDGLRRQIAESLSTAPDNDPLAAALIGNA